MSSRLRCQKVGRSARAALAATAPTPAAIGLSLDGCGQQLSDWIDQGGAVYQGLVSSEDEVVL